MPWLLFRCKTVPESIFEFTHGARICLRLRWCEGLIIFPSSFSLRCLTLFRGRRETRSAINVIYECFVSRNVSSSPISFPSSYWLSSHSLRSSSSFLPLLLIHITYILLHLLFFYLLLLPSKRLQSDRLAARPRPSILSRAHLPTTHESQLSHHEGRAPRTLLFLLLLSSFASASPHLLRDSLRLKLLASIPWLIFLSLPLSLG